jgi:hypothetical protein
MDMTAVRALAQTVAASTHGVDLTVTVPGGSPVARLKADGLGGIWLQHADEAMPVGRDFQRREPRRLMAIPLDATLSDVPRGSLVVAAPRGTSATRTWRVETVDRFDADQIRVIVAPVN